LNRFLIDFLPALWILAEVSHCICKLFSIQLMARKHRINLGASRRAIKRGCIFGRVCHAGGNENLRIDSCKIARIPQGVFICALAGHEESDKDQAGCQESVHVHSHRSCDGSNLETRL
jgi:hypothetical protein